MKKFGATPAVLGLLLLVAVGCGSSSDVDPAKAQSEVTVGMTQQQVRDVLGDPSALVTQEVFDVEEIQMIYLNRDDNVRVTVSLEDDSVTEVVTEPIEE